MTRQLSITGREEMDCTVGVVGAGNMGSALVRGLRRSPDAGPSVLVYDVVEQRTRDLMQFGGVRAAATLEELGRLSELIIVSVKPGDVRPVLTALRPFLEGKVVVSSAAGVALDGLRPVVGPGTALLRMMPNLGVELGQGVVALTPESGTAADVVEKVRTVLASLGVVEVLPEDALDAVTAVSGSSIAFIALALEGMEDGAVRVGLSRVTARAFVRQTALAAALLLQRHAGSAADIKDQVASPGGTTIAGLAVLEERAVRGSFVRAIEESTEQARRLRDTGPPDVVE